MTNIILVNQKATTMLRKELLKLISHRSGDLNQDVKVFKREAGVIRGRGFIEQHNFLDG